MLRILWKSSLISTLDVPTRLQTGFIRFPERNYYSSVL